MKLESLPVVETFHSIQGEGFHSGRSAFFIRLGGCSVGCPWCDTKESWPASAHQQRPIPELVTEAAKAQRSGAGFTVVTGGEPIEHSLDHLSLALTAIGIPVHLETSGVGELSGHFSWITLSPKPHRPPSTAALEACNELKVVVHSSDDLDFAKAIATASRQAKGPHQAAPQLLLQPGWECALGQELAIDFVRSHPQWRLSLQSHKWLGVR